MCYVNIYRINYKINMMHVSDFVYNLDSFNTFVSSSLALWIFSYCSLKKVFTLRRVWLFSRSYKLLTLKITCTSYQAKAPDGCALLPQIPWYYKLFTFGKNILAFIFREIYFLKKIDLFILLFYKLIYCIDFYLVNLLLKICCCIHHRCRY